MYKTKEQAIRTMERHLKKFAYNGADVKIYTWPSKRFSVRVAEVAFTTGLAGASFMQSDPDGLAVCAAVERCIIDHMAGTKEDLAISLDCLNYHFK